MATNVTFLFRCILEEALKHTYFLVVEIINLCIFSLSFLTFKISISTIINLVTYQKGVQKSEIEEKAV